MASQSLRSHLHTQHVAQASRVRSRRLRITRLTQALLGCAILTPAFAGPTVTPAINPSTLPKGMQVQHGQASVMTQGHQMTVRNSQGAILNWQDFSIGSGASVYFDQSNSSSKVLNRVLGNDPSQILGQLGSNGQVWLLNPNGVLFGRDARVDVASLVTSTLRLNDNDFLASRYRFDSQAGDAGVLRNEGVIHSSLGGHVVLLGSRVENAGSIEAPQGRVALAAARQVELVDTGAPNLRVQVDVPAGEVLNLGQLQAHGGRIDVHAATVNQQGLVKADTLSTDAQGRIVLKASEVLNLADSSQIRADGLTGGTIQLDAGQGTAWVRGQVSAQGSQGRGGELKLLGQQIGVLDGAQLNVSGQSGGGTLLVGGGAEGKDASVPNARAVYVAEQASLSADALKQGQGGNIVLWSNQATRAYGRFSAKGGAQGGDGGLVETSGGWLDAQPAGMSLQAPKGRAGTWLLDPNNITIRDGGVNTNISGGPNFTSTNDNSVINTATIAAALNAGNSVTISTGTGGSNSQAGDIDASMTINVAPPAPVSLTLKAARDIWLHDSTITANGSPLSLSLQAAGSGKGAVNVSNVAFNSSGGDLFLGGTLAIQLPIPGSGFTATTYAAARDFDVTNADLPRMAMPSIGAAGVIVGDSQLRLGSGRLTAYGVGPYGGVDVISSTIEAKSLETVGSATGGVDGLGVIGSSFTSSARLSISDTVDISAFGTYSGLFFHRGSTLLAGSSLAPASRVSIRGNGNTNDGVWIESAAGQVSPVLTLNANVVSITGSSNSATGNRAGVRVTGVQGAPTLDLSGSTAVNVFGTVQGTGNAIRLSSASVLGPTGNGAVLQLNASGAGGVGKVSLLNSQVSASGSFSMSGQAVWLEQSQVVNGSNPLTITATTSGINPLGVFVTGSTLKSGGGAIDLGSGLVANDSVAAVNVYNSELDAGSGAISMRGNSAASTGVLVDTGTRLSASNGQLSITGAAGKGSGVWLKNGMTAEAGSQIVINGKGGVNGGEGVTMNGAQLKAGAVQITGQGVADAANVFNAFGVAAAASTDGLNTPTRITTQQLTVDGRSDASASRNRKAGVNFDGGTAIRLSGHKASTVSGDSVVLQDSNVLGDASAWTVSSGDSIRSTKSTFDFSTGTGTTVSFLADTDGNQLGRVRLDNTQINTGGGDFKAQGVGIHGGDDTNPSLAVNGSNGIFFDRGGVNAGQGRIDLLGSGGYAGVNFFGTDPITLLADTINIQGKRRPDSPALGVAVGDFANSEFTPLNLKARNITVSGTGAAYNATEKVASLGMGLYSTGTWEASNQISISTDAGGLELGGLTLKAPSISISSAEQFETQQAKILAGKLANITALGGTDPSKAFGIRMGQNAVIQGADIVLAGTARAGVGVELATTNTESVLEASNSITITGRDASGVQDGLSVSGDWNLIAGDTISIISEGGVNLAERNVNLPHYMAGKRLQVQVNKHPGGSISSADAENFSATIADMPSTAVTSVRFDSAAPIVLDGVINSPSRIELGADHMTIGSQGGIRSSATGDAVRLQGFTNPGMQSFTNQAGGNALQTPNGRWIVRATKPEVVQWLGLQPMFTAYDGERFPPALDAAGNWVTPGAGNGVIYQISSATQDAATQSTQVVISTATQAVSIPTVMSTPSEGRVLDATPALGHSLDESKPSFGSINTSSMSRAELVTLLAARAAYKKKLFADTLHQLQLDPSLADVRACANIAELNAGNCLLTESLKREIRPAQALETLQRSKARKVRQAELPAIERKVALVIGINEYSDKRIPGLESAVPDARAIHELIEQQLGYEAVVLENANKQSIITALNKIALEAGPNDSVMIYYAGHGEVLPTSGMGYWLPADARVDKPQSWLSNADIARMVALIGAKQVMLVSDSCYSGTLAGTDRVQLTGNLAADDLLSRKAVVVMSSGGNEPVSDEGRDGHSVFAWHLMQKLRATAAWQVGSQAFTQVRDAVLKDFPQTPQYGAARAAGHQDNTDYVFERRQTDKQ